MGNFVTHAEEVTHSVPRGVKTPPYLAEYYRLEQTRSCELIRRLFHACVLTKKYLDLLTAPSGNLATKLACHAIQKKIY